MAINLDRGPSLVRQFLGLAGQCGPAGDGVATESNTVMVLDGVLALLQDPVWRVLGLVSDKLGKALAQYMLI